MANINFPLSPTVGNTYSYKGVTYTFNAEGFWAITTPGTIGIASKEEVNAGEDVVKYVTPASLKNSKYDNGGGGTDLSGKLEWGYPLGPFQGIIPTVPTITGSTWTHTVVEASNEIGSTLPAVAYSSLLKNGTYVELDLSLPDEYIFFYAVLQNGLPSFEPLGGEASSAYVAIKVAPTGIELTSGIPSAAMTIPNTEGVTSFGISAGDASGYPRIHVNGTSYEVPLGNFELYHSLMTAYAGQVGDQVTVTLDPVSTVHRDPAYPYVPLSEVGGLLSPAMYGVPQAALQTNTLDNPNDRAAYKISPKNLNQWFNEKVLTQADIDNATSNKGVVSGELLAGLGGGGTVKTILLRDDGAGGSTWQHLISSADLTDGDDFIFILGNSSSADLNVVCIPTEADVPELANISELKLVVYGGSGKSGFSENFNGVGTGAQVLGTEGVAGSGCVIARKVGLDTWYLSYEVTKPSGPEVLKDWTTTTALDTNLFEGLDVSSLDYNEVYIEFRNVRGATNGNSAGYIRLEFREAGNVVIDAGSKKSKVRSLSSDSPPVTINNEFALVNCKNELSNGFGTVELFGSTSLWKAGYTSSMMCVNGAAQVTNSNLFQTTAEFHTYFSNREIPAELWLTGLSSTVYPELTFQADYRILKR